MPGGSNNEREPLRAGRVLSRAPAFAALGLIRAYRYTLSSLFGRTCRHLPTCSEYTEDAVRRYGLWRGGWIGLARFWRCRPFGSEGFDPAPESLPASSRWYTPWRYGRWSSRI